MKIKLFVKYIRIKIYACQGYIFQYWAYLKMLPIIIPIIAGNKIQLNEGPNKELFLEKNAILCFWVNISDIR